jgi:hypothetical protein
MIFEFQSRAAGNVVMTGKVAERMLGIIGKPAGSQGIITVAQLPEAIARLKAAIADERSARDAARAASAPGPSASAGGHDEEGAGTGAAVSFEARAVPLIEMFERSLAAQRDVTWGL